MTNKYYFLPSDKGFYLEPKEDSIELTEEEYRKVYDEHLTGRNFLVVDGKLTTVAPTPRPFDIEAYKVYCSTEITNAFNSEVEQPITVHSIDWFGGFDSAIKLNGVKQLAELSGEKSVVYFDVNRNAHTLTFDDAITIIKTIGNSYQTKFAKKQSLLQEIGQATSKEELDKIVW